MVGPLDPLVSAAIAEAPIELSGVSARQKAAVEAETVALAHPDEMRVVAITEAIEATTMAERAATLTLQSAFGLASTEFDEALGAPTRLAWMRVKLGEAEDGGLSAARR